MMVAEDDTRAEFAFAVRFAALPASGPLLIAFELSLTAGQAFS